jgi:hypothetical protein
VFHGQSTPYVEPRGELSSFYDEHSRVVHVHDPVRTFFNISDARPAAGRSLSDNAGALSMLQVSRIFHNRVVIAAADVRKSSEPDESWTCTPATTILGVAESRTSPTRGRSPCTRNGRPRGFASKEPFWGPCLDAFLPTIAFPQPATPSVLSPTQLPGKGLEQHPFLSRPARATRRRRGSSAPSAERRP